MSRITITLGQKQKCNTIPIGRVGENVVTEVAFDFGQWAEEYGTGNAALVAQRNGDAQPYPVTLTVSGTVAVWSITDADVAITGMGKAQVSYIVGEAVKKSDIYQTVCKNSLTGSGEAPDPYDDWMDALERLTAQNSAYAQQASESATNASQSAEQAQEALEEFESVTVSATTLPEGSSATASYADGHIAFGIPRGNTGAQGPQGPRGEQGIQGIQGERGERGLQGERGADGITPDFSIGTVETLDAGSDATATITGTTEAPVLNLGIPRGADGTTPTIYGDASGAIASFDDGADNRPVQSLSITIEPVQSGSGTPSPDNVRPISGWTGAEVTNKDDMTNPTVTRTYPIPFPSTVYGGTLEVETGVLTVDRYEHTFDGTESIGRQSGNQRFTYTMASAVSTAVSDQMCSALNPNNDIVYGNTTNHIVYGLNTTIYWRWDEYTDTASMLAKFAEMKTNGTPMQFVAKLQNPVTIQLTSTEVTTLLGDNNIFSDTGDVSVKYERDWNIVINKILGA